MTTEQNIVNMRKCPRFEGCSIPKCPLDYWAKERIQLAEDMRCPNWSYLNVFVSKDKKQGKKIPKVGDILSNMRGYTGKGLKQALVE
jgi:hypothetical protein